VNAPAEREPDRGQGSQLPTESGNQSSHLPGQFPCDNIRQHLRRSRASSDWDRLGDQFGREDPWTSTRRLHIERDEFTAWPVGAEVITRRRYDQDRRCWMVPVGELPVLYVWAEQHELRFVTTERVEP
jgi:hypothetical protein